MLKSISRIKELRPIYLAYFLDGLEFTFSIWLFFYLQQFDYSQIAILVVIRMVSALFFEVPTGAFADLLGRKKSLFLSYVLYAGAFFATAFAQGFYIFIIIQIVKGLAQSLFSGAYEALTYDTLKSIKKEESYNEVVADQETITWIAYFISSFSGGILFALNAKLPFIIVGVIYTFNAFLYLFFVKEPLFDSVKYSVKAYLKQNLQGFSELFKNVNIGLISLILILISFGYITASELIGISQLADFNFSGTQVGFIFGVGYIISALVSQAFPFLKKKLGTRFLLPIVVTILFLSLIGTKFVPAGIGMLFIIGRISSSTTFRNLRSSLVNTYISSKNRATALSTLSLLFQLPFVVVFLLFNGELEILGPNNFTFFLGIAILTVVTILVLLKFLYAYLERK